MFSYLGRNLSDIWGLEKEPILLTKGTSPGKGQFLHKCSAPEREVFIWATGRMTMDTARMTGDNQPPVVSPQPRKLGVNRHGRPAGSIACSTGKKPQYSSPQAMRDRYGWERTTEKERKIQK